MSIPILARDNIHLKQLIGQAMAEAGNTCSLNHIDVSGIEDFAGLFSDEYSGFNGDISRWNVSKVRTMALMFHNSIFRNNISHWNTASLEDMGRMFENAHFNGDLSKWDTSSVWDMSSLFKKSPFNGDVSAWDVSRVTTMAGLFEDSQFRELGNGKCNRYGANVCQGSCTARVELLGYLGCGVDERNVFGLSCG